MSYEKIVDTGMEMQMIIKVKTDKEYKAKINEFRQDGWFLITFGKKFSELEKAGRITVVER